jgi:hypothetical protein
MSEAFDKHVDKRISEIHERMRNYKLKKKPELKIFKTTQSKDVGKYQ